MTTKQVDVYLRCSEATKKRIASSAKKSGIHISEWIRDAIDVKLKSQSKK